VKDVRKVSKTTIMLKTGGLGDLLMLTPSIRAYKKSFPDEKIVFLIGKSNEQTLQNNPYINQIIPVDDSAFFKGGFLRKLLSSLRLIQIIKNYKPQHLFIFHRDWRWNLVAFLSRIRQRYGFKRDFKGKFLTESVEASIEEHEIQKYLNVCALRPGFTPDGVEMEIFPSIGDQTFVEELFSDLTGNKKYIAMSPGGAANIKEEMDIRRWPLNYYKMLVRFILNKTDGSILLIGAESDNSFNEELLVDQQRVFNLAGKTTIAQTYLTLQRCRVFITHDSGPMHIGAAAQIPVIGLFGPTYPVEKYPLTHPLSLYIWEGSKLTCSPCYKDGNFPECPYDKKCMRLISPEEVFERLLKICEVSNHTFS